MHKECINPLMHFRQPQMQVEKNNALMRCDAMSKNQQKKQEYQAAVRAYIARVMLEKGWSQQELGSRSGAAQSTIGRALDPEYPFQTKTTLLFAIQKASGIPLPPELAPGSPGLFDNEREYQTPTPNARPMSSATSPRSAELKPIYASAHGGDGEQILAPGEIVEWRAPPQRWDSVRGLYGFYVVGDSMSPRVNPGEMVWVHPHRQAQPGQEGVFIHRNGENGTTPIMVKELVKVNAAHWTVKQHNPEREFQLKRDEWQCQLVVDIDLNR